VTSTGASVPNVLLKYAHCYPQREAGSKIVWNEKEEQAISISLQSNPGYRTSTVKYMLYSA